MEEWVTLQQGVYPAYISWEQFLHNQARLAENTEGKHMRNKQLFRGHVEPPGKGKRCSKG